MAAHHVECEPHARVLGPAGVPAGIGLAIDGTIHLFSRYNALCRRSSDYDEAVLTTVREEATPILATSLALFNSHGEPNVTTNHIADEADISPGNLYYHFRSKNDIVIELFKRFLTRLQPVVDIPDDVLLSTDDLWFQLHMGFEIKGDYRFLYRNLADISARIPELDRAGLRLGATLEGSKYTRIIP